VHTYLDDFARYTNADELMVAHQAPSVESRLRSVVLLGEGMLEASAS
jgi:hypothetical protein